ncbi:heavy metal translocating P-type ATPase [Sinirhodobacter huangdaonensis]|uniref:P-type Cu(+) transporter n=1 Tax=Paenirhodobacter huangdaonensis TaxID=2501515 RepID=A0A3S3M032_9RHOB|nr:heavy metal translocating P-type ATPase [Sinirhodobacter huangdaonensis]RWR53202.1 heavy metal translocating P-type ATPase [Sinirhodobacter huangdaonensis]
MSKTTFTIDGMHCGACTGRVERTLSAEPGVKSAAANLMARSARVEFEAPATPASLAAALAKAGYPVNRAEAKLDITGMTCASCVSHVEHALTALPGVIEASVNLATQTAQVGYAQGAVAPSEMVKAVEGAGYGAHVATADAPAAPVAERQAAEAAKLKRQVLLSAALTLPVFVLAMGSHLVPGFHMAVMHTIGERASWWIQLVLTALVLAFPGRVFLRIGIPALLRGAPEMNSLVAMGALAAFLYSAVVTLAPDLLPASAREVYFEAAAVIVTLILVGRWLEARAKGRAGEAISRLVALRPATARVARESGTVELPVEELAPGDIVLLAPGERVAVDGLVTEGHGWIDESMLTGEPAPVEKTPGAEITGGTVNGQAALAFRVTATGTDTVLARIIALVEEAQGQKLPVQALVDKVTRVFVPAVMGLSLLTFALWMLAGQGFTHALVAAISVMIIACPCAMGLATPVSILVGTGRGAELGLLFRRGDALQRLSEVKTLAFDKTGTLTLGHPELTDLIPVAGLTAEDALATAAAPEVRSEHPLARAIVAAAAARGLPLPRARKVEALPGRGLTAEVDGHAVLLGNARAMTEAGIDIGPLAAQALALAGEGKTPVYLARDGAAMALLAVADPIKEHAAEAVSALQTAGVEVALVTGDAKPTAEAVARRLGITRVVAEVLPEGKVAAVNALGSTGAVAFVGDGINDAPALAAADVGLAIGTGTDVAIEAAEVVLMGDDPRGAARALRLSRAVMRNIRENLFWAFAYNVALIPVAMGVLRPFGGPGLSPMLAAGAMAFSSVFVVTNALRLRRARF